ncbi:MAG TPA: hypothetical protein VG518_01805, partial [Solirubrobacterales bacterium]|nr:hypothetical protein [Solirubrobacterales bacterium]
AAPNAATKVHAMSAAPGERIGVHLPTSYCQPASTAQPEPKVARSRVSRERPRGPPARFAG